MRFLPFWFGRVLPVQPWLRFHIPLIELSMRLFRTGIYQPSIQNLELADFKVRILTGGTDAVTRVLIESLDRKSGRRWFTVGVSPNIVDASFEALLDSIAFKLWTDGVAPAPTE